MEPSDALGARLEAMSGIGKRIHAKDTATGERNCWGTIEDEVYIIYDDYERLIQ